MPAAAKTQTTKASAMSLESSTESYVRGMAINTNNKHTSLAEHVYHCGSSHHTKRFVEITTAIADRRDLACMTISGRRILSLWLVLATILVQITTGSSFSLSTLLSRRQVAEHASLLVGSSSFPSSFFLAARQSSLSPVLSLPLTFLPNAGCLAVRINVYCSSNNRASPYQYYAIVDTGSPFWTAPAWIGPITTDECRRYPTTQEQYGQAMGSMSWRSLPHVEFQGIDSPGWNNIFVGIPQSNVVEDTGGIFLGLLWQDDNRPTVLQQLGYSSFAIDYPSRRLELTRGNTSVLLDDPMAMELFDFAPYGSNVHHYGILCESFVLQLNNGNYRGNKTITVSSLKRPVVVVVDTGLTGCIFSDSLRNELQAVGRLEPPTLLESICGLAIALPTLSGARVVLSSDPNYWYVSSFKLPWFDKYENNHPHVIAMGATFLANSKLVIDPVARHAKLET